MLHKMKFIIRIITAPGPKIKQNYNHRGAGTVRWGSRVPLCLPGAPGQWDRGVTDALHIPEQGLAPGG